MSLTTRCPSCGTMFKVVPDQLRISEGWVRCGHCTGVFDASSHLVEPGQALPEVSAAAPVPAPPVSPPPALPPSPVEPEPAVWRHRSVAARTVWQSAEPASTGEEDQEDEPFGTYTAPGLDQLEFPDPPAPPTLTEDVPSALLLQTADSDEPQDLLYQPAFAAPAPALAGSAEAEVEAELARQTEPPLLFPADPEPLAEPAAPAPPRTERRSARRRPMIAAEREAAARGPDSVSSQWPDSLSPPDSHLPPDSVPPPPDSLPAPDPLAAPAPGAAVHAEALQDLGFVRAAGRRAFWRRPAVTAASALACLLLVLLLLLQVVVVQRDVVAAHLPGLRATLEALCAPLQCRVAPLRRIDSIVIDGSAFNKARGDFYQLNVDLRSTAGVPLAMPSLELTLTDTDDKPLLRRVLAPAELHAPQVLPASGAWSGTLPVRLQAPVDAARVAGYRVLAFYP